MAGIPQLNSALYHRIRFLVGDPVAYVQLPTADGGVKSILILRGHRDGPGPPPRGPTKWPARAILRRPTDCPATARRPRPKRRPNASAARA